MEMIPKRDLLIVLNTLSQVEINNNLYQNLLDTLCKLQDVKTFSSLEALPCIKAFSKKVNTSSHCSSVERFIVLSLECLMRLKQTLESEEIETERLLSVAQQKSVRGLVDTVTSLGIWPCLLPGVCPPINNTAVSCVHPELSDFEKYDYLCLVTSVLIDLYHNDTFHGILLPQFLTPVMCALCQLTMVPLNKSGDTYSQLQEERLVFQQHLDEIVNNLYQPMVTKELMVIEGNTKCPKWLKQGVGRLLTKQLHRPHGVLAILEAITDAANCTAPTTDTHLESVARVITASPDLDKICPQILELLDSKRAELIKMGVLCVKTLHDRDASACKVHLLEPLAKPLRRPPVTTEIYKFSEQDLTLCLNRLHKCFAVPASDLWCLPPQLLLPNIKILFQLYCKIYQSVSHVRQIVEDLVWRFLSTCDESLLKNVFFTLLFRRCFPGIKLNSNYVEFIFGDGGGVKLVTKPHNCLESLEDYGDCLMILFERRDTSGLVRNKLFVTLLEFSADEEKEYTFTGFERQLLAAKLLSALSENTLVQKNLSKNPQSVIKFLKVMIQRYLLDMNINAEIVKLVLLIINVIVGECIRSESIDWELFMPLEEPLFQLKNKTENGILRLLAEDVHERIATRGEMDLDETENTESPKEDILGNSDSCSEALQEACDPLLPVRGHALMQLGRLLAAGDEQAKAKKDQILCIFQENLKEEDSFLYLSAIDGLATAAAEFPDTVIMLLTEQFTRQALRPDTRLKVGEALVRVTKLLGELTPVYKAELINAFLSGTRDDDFLVRASSLSNLGELCRALGFRVGPIITEVLMCADCIIHSDPAVEVRRAAVMLIYLLLKGLETYALTVLKDVILELYRSLKHIYATDKDDVTRIHAQLALEELNSGTIAFLFPKPQLTKQIFVLDPPV